VNVMKFNKAKCKVLHLGQGNPQSQNRLGDEWIESSATDKYLGVLAAEKLNKCQQSALADHTTNHILGCIKSCMASMSREKILPSTLLS